MNKGDLIFVDKRATLRNPESGKANNFKLNENKYAIFLETLSGWEGKESIWSNIPTNKTKWFFVLIEGTKYLISETYILHNMPAMGFVVDYKMANCALTAP